jgi:hypothetical protein
VTFQKSARFEAKLAQRRHRLAGGKPPFWGRDCLCAGLPGPKTPPAREFFATSMNIGLRNPKAGGRADMRDQNLHHPPVPLGLVFSVRQIGCQGPAPPPGLPVAGPHGQGKAFDAVAVAQQLLNLLPMSHSRPQTARPRPLSVVF